MSKIELREEPYAPMKVIQELDSDSTLMIIPPKDSKGLYLSAEGDMLEGWNKKKTPGSHSIFSSENPDYDTGVVGTVRLLNDVADGIYLTNVDGSKKGLTLLPSIKSVDTDAFTMTEEFTIVNEGVGTDVVVIDDCSSTAEWAPSFGTDPVIESDGYELHYSAIAEGGAVLVKFNGDISALSSSEFLIVSIRVPVGSVYDKLFVRLTDVNGNTKLWHNSIRFVINTSVTKFVLPVNAPMGTTGALPTLTTWVTGEFDSSAIVRLEIGVPGTTGSFAELYIDNVAVCNGTWTNVECAIPDTLQSPHGNEFFRVGGYTLNDDSYSSKPSLAWDYNAIYGAGAVNAIFDSTSEFMDGTAFWEMYGTNITGDKYGRGGTLYPVGEKGELVTYPLDAGWRDPNAPSMVYSSAYGTAKRIGFALLIPPSDNDRTNINKVQLKLVTYYDDELGNIVPDLSGNENDGTIVGNVVKLSNGGLKFDGSVSGKVNIPLIELSKDDSKIEISFKFDDVGLDYRALLGWAATQYNSYVSIRNTNNIFCETLLNGETFGFIAVSTGEIVHLTIEFVNGTCTTTDGISTHVMENITSNTKFDLVGSTYDGTGAATKPFIGEIYEIKLWNNGELVRWYKPELKNMGATTLEFAPDSSDHFLGLNHLENYVAFERPDRRIETYYFNRKIKTLSLTQILDGSLVRFDMGFKAATKVARSWIHYPDFDKDSDGNTIPNFIDKCDKISNKFAFIHEYRTEYDITVSNIPNDFGVVPSEHPMAFPIKSRVYDESGNLLPELEAISTETGDIKLVDVTGLSKVQIQTPPGDVAGDVTVWDTVTVGNTVESTWIRVTDVNHVFSGTCVVQNGLVRIIMSTTIDNILFYSTVSSSYVGMYRNLYLELTSVDNISIDSVTVSTSLFKLTILRGRENVLFSNVTGLGVYLHLSPSILINLDNVIDCAFQGLPTDYEIITPNMYMVSFDRTSNVMCYIVPISSGSISYGNGNAIPVTILSGRPSFIIGALPISPIYFEGEDMISTGGFLYTGTDAYPKIGNTGMGINTKNDIIVKYDQVLPIGKYTIFFRTKETIDTINGDYIFYIRDTVSLNFLLSNSYEPNENFAIHSATFEVTQNNPLNFYLYQHADTGTIECVLDYVIVVPTGESEKVAERSFSKVEINNEKIIEV